MLNRVIESIKVKYWYFCILAIYICIFLGIAVYDYLPQNANTEVIINNNKLKLEYNLKDEKYIFLDDLILNFPNNVYYDKIARRLVITGKDDILKIKVGDDYSVSYNNTIWYDMCKMAEYFGYKTFKDTRSNEIYVYDELELPATVITNRTMVYANDKSEIIGVLDSKSGVSILLNENAYFKEENFFVVKITTKQGVNYIGRIEKSDLAYEEIQQENTINETEQVIMTTVSNKLSSSTDLNIVNTLAVEMLRINSEKSIIEETYTLGESLKQDVYAVLTNGYKLSSFDNSILSSIVASDTNKENISNQIVDFLNNKKLKGLVIDFKNFKVSDKELIEQYIKELAAMLHKNDKKIMVKMTTSSSYDVDSIKDFVDYIIVQAYGNRTLASKIIGSHSSVTYVQNLLEQFLTKVDNTKIVLELATYSILWTEKSGSVINAELYSMNTANEYIKTNGIQTIFDSVSGQNMISYTKGSITYKMWLEDELSLTTKTNLAKDIGISNFAIYRSGYENKSIYSILDGGII